MDEKLKCAPRPECTGEVSWVVTDLAGDDYGACFDHLLQLLTLVVPRDKSVSVRRSKYAGD